MFQRLLLANWSVLVTMVAFVTAVSVCVTFLYRTLRMRPPQCDRLARMPLEDETPSRRHET
jgi:hypothetical protein